MRQHVNPLSRFFQIPRELPALESLFSRPDLPLHVDIGSAGGKFLLEMAVLSPEWNHLGVEIRSPLVKSAQTEMEKLALKNLQFLFCNVNVSLVDWLEFISANRLRRVSIQFPDPWFKRRHRKRRVLQPLLLNAIAKALPVGGDLFIQSDQMTIIQPMFSLVASSQCFDCLSIDPFNSIQQNPYPVKSEREIYAFRNGLPIYRLLFKRNNNPPLELSVLEEQWNKNKDLMKE